MKPTFFLACLSFLMVLGSPCDQVYDMGYDTCKFYLSYPPPLNCDKFTLDYCDWSRCSGGDCQLKKLSSWSDCTYACCDADRTYPMSQQGLEACRQYVQDTYRFSIIMMVLMIMFFAGCCLGCCCCCCCSCCRNRCQPIRNGIRQGCNRVLECICCCCYRGHRAQVRDQEQPSMQQLQIEYGGKQLRWQLEEYRNPHLDNVCSICLQGRPTLQLNCGHVYHAVCILVWLQKKQECVMCRSTQIDKVRVYCQKCEASYAKAHLKIHREQLANNLLCDKCQQKGEAALEHIYIE